jgi:thiosulfate/3-mercaptopyruvate sulfurtransferase
MSLWQAKQTWGCIGILLFMLTAIAYVTQASECGDLSKYLNKSCGTSGSDGWDPLAKLDEIGTGQANQDQSDSPNWAKVSRQYRWNQTDLNPDDASPSMAAPGSSSAKGSAVALPANKPTSKSVEKATSYIEPKRSSSFYAMMAPLSNVSQFDVILDVSSGVRKFIPGAVNIDYLRFQDKDGNLRAAAELAKVLGDSGISRNNSVLIYGECTCALGPSISTYVYWVMRYLGHDPDKLRVLDGGLVDWAAANHTVENQSRNLPNTTYSFEQNPELLATYEEVKSSQDVKSGHMLIDARPLQDFSNDSLGNAISIPFDKVILNGRLKDESETKRMFSKFPNESPIIIYSKQGVQASLIWFSIEMMGYHAKLYTLMDWQNHKNQRTNMAN